MPKILHSEQKLNELQVVCSNILCNLLFVWVFVIYAN